jgi:hypothetical protein
MDDLDAVAAGKMEAGKCHTAGEPWQHRRFVRFSRSRKTGKRCISASFPVMKKA